jgi:Zn-dependent peptidase ImmA (M78 family)
MDEFHADYKAAAERAYELLISSRVIKTFPFDFFSLIYELGKEVDIRINTFSWFTDRGMNPKELIQSDDADTYELNGRYIIFYNETKPRNRIAFSMAHELGHLLLFHDLDHLDEFRNSDHMKFFRLYNRYEKEANVFASYLLMPDIILRRLSLPGGRFTSYFIESMFGVSQQAAEIKLKTMKWDFRVGRDFEDEVLRKFDAFIKSAARERKTYHEEFEYDLRTENERNLWIAER